MDASNQFAERDQLAVSAVSYSPESHGQMMNFSALQKLHEKAFGAYSHSSTAGSSYSPPSSAGLSNLSLPFGDLDLDSSDSTPNSPEFDSRQLDSDSSSSDRSSGLRTPESSPAKARTAASNTNSVSQKGFQGQKRGGWSSASTSSRSTASSSADSSPELSPRSQSTVLPATAAHASEGAKSHSTLPTKKTSTNAAAAGGVRHPAGVPLSLTATSTPKPRLKSSPTAHSAPTQSARQAEESRRGRNRWPRILWRSEIDSSSLDVLEQYHTRAVGEPLPVLDVKMNAAAVGQWSRKLERAGL